MPMQDQQMITIVGTVYETVAINSASFQRQIEQNQREEKRAEEVQREREIVEPNTTAKDVVELSKAAADRAQAEEEEAVEKAAPPVQDPAPAPERGQLLNAVA